MSLNVCQFIGRLVDDPISMPQKDGSAIWRFSLAVQAHWKDRDGHKASAVEWVDFVAFGKIGTIVKKFCRKGTRVWVQGRLHTHHYEQEGKKRRKVQIVLNKLVFMDKAKKADDSASEEAADAEEDDEAPF